MKLRAALKDYLWGGTRLKTEYGKETNLEKIAESWELSCHKAGLSIIENGEAQGKALKTYLAECQTQGEDLVGIRGERFAEFPMLVKLIDAKEALSVQVHPNDAYARAAEENTAKPKCGMWWTVSRIPISTMD